MFTSEQIYGVVMANLSAIMENQIFQALRRRRSRPKIAKHGGLAAQAATIADLDHHTKKGKSSADDDK